MTFKEWFFINTLPDNANPRVLIYIVWEVALEESEPLLHLRIFAAVIAVKWGNNKVLLASRSIHKKILFLRLFNSSPF